MSDAFELIGVWRDVKKILRVQVSNPEYARWADIAWLISLGDDSVVIAAPGEISAQLMAEDLAPAMARAFSTVLRRPMKVKVEIRKPAPKIVQEQPGLGLA
ncbi:MAG: hypothetical protein AB1921_02765 [Thermodesulfobacteriota bacterium]